MSGAWERRRILIWGKTRPEVSRNYRETVCTGGVFEDTGRLVRLYPIPLRYLDDEQYFKKYQWIRADVTRADDRDDRPESYRIRPDGIELEDTIPTAKGGDWSKRAEWILRPENVVQSVEELQARQAKDRTSLGVLKPKQIIQVVVENYAKDQREAFWRRYKETVAQLRLAIDEEREPKPLTPPDYRFQIRFTCNDAACTRVHKFGILDWEVDALYFNLKSKYQNAERAKQEVVKNLEMRCASDHDTRFFLGNISTHPTNFTIVGLWYPKIPRQRSLELLDGVS